MLKKHQTKIVIKKLAQFSEKKALGVLIFGQGNVLVIMERALMIEAVALIMGVGFYDWRGALIMGVRLYDWSGCFDYRVRLYDWSGCFDYGGEAL